MIEVPLTVLIPDEINIQDLNPAPAGKNLDIEFSVMKAIEEANNFKPGCFRNNLDFASMFVQAWYEHHLANGGAHIEEFNQFFTRPAMQKSA